jgi:hypothetical protein
LLVTAAAAAVGGSRRPEGSDGLPYSLLGLRCRLLTTQIGLLLSRRRGFPTTCRLERLRHPWVGGFIGLGLGLDSALAYVWSVRVWTDRNLEILTGQSPVTVRPGGRNVRTLDVRFAYSHAFTWAESRMLYCALGLSMSLTGTSDRSV